MALTFSCFCSTIRNYVQEGIKRCKVQKGFFVTLVTLHTDRWHALIDLSVISITKAITEGLGRGDSSLFVMSRSENFVKVRGSSTEHKRKCGSRI